MASGMASGTLIPYRGIPSRFGDEMGMDLGFDPGNEMEDPGADHRDSVDKCDSFFFALALRVFGRCLKIFGHVMSYDVMCFVCFVRSCLSMFVSGFEEYEPLDFPELRDQEGSWNHRWKWINIGSRLTKIDKD